MLPTRYGPTYVMASGPADAPPMFLLHALSVPSLMWRPNIAALSAEHRCYALDTIGDLGRSVLEDPARYPRGGADYSAWLRDIADGLAVGRADLVASSMGGWIALSHAVHAPDRVRRLALLAPMGLPSWPVTLGVILRLTVATLGGGRGTTELITWALGSDPSVHHELGGFLELAFGSRPRVAAPLPLTARALQRIAAPTLVLLGERDGPIGDAPSVARRAQRHIPGVHVEVIAGVGHLMNIERPELVSDRIGRHFA